MELTIQRIVDPVLGAWTDSSLYNAEGELVDVDSDLEGYDKHKLYSQGGAFLAMLPKNSLEDISGIPFSIADWRTRASRRVLHSTFAAEASACAETVGLSKFYRAYYCDVLLGYADWLQVDSYGEEHLPIVVSVSYTHLTLPTIE